MIPKLRLNRTLDLANLRIRREANLVELLHHRPGSEATQRPPPRFRRTRRILSRQRGEARLTLADRFQYRIRLLDGGNEDVTRRDLDGLGRCTVFFVGECFREGVE